MSTEDTMNNPLPRKSDLQFKRGEAENCQLCDAEPELWEGSFSWDQKPHRLAPGEHMKVMRCPSGGAAFLGDLDYENCPFHKPSVNFWCSTERGALQWWNRNMKHWVDVRRKNHI